MLSFSLGHGGNCCTEGIMNCAIQTFFKMSTNRPERCNLVNFYDVCMNETSNMCHSETLKTSYPVFVSQMKRQCRGPLKRKKRSIILEDIFSVKTWTSFWRKCYHVINQTSITSGDWQIRQETSKITEEMNEV